MKKHLQLGMNAGTASHRLVKDLLFKFVTEAGYKCFRCNEPLTREDFSVEHKVPWLDSDDPVALFFDLDNIAFSHKLCNSKLARQPTKAWATDEERKERDAAVERGRWQTLPKGRQQQIRRDKYLRNGC